MADASSYAARQAMLARHAADSDSESTGSVVLPPPKRRRFKPKPKPRYPKLTAMFKQAAAASRKSAWSRAHKALKSSMVEQSIGEKDPEVPDGELPRNNDALFGVRL